MQVYDVKRKKYLTVETVGPKYVTRRRGFAFGYKTNVVTSKMNVPAFVLLKGSVVAPTPTRSCQVHILELRKNCPEILTNNVVNRDSLFTSSTAAATFVCYAAANGKDVWSVDNDSSDGNNE